MSGKQERVRDENDIEEEIFFFLVCLSESFHQRTETSLMCVADMNKVLDFEESTLQICDVSRELILVFQEVPAQWAN